MSFGEVDQTEIQRVMFKAMWAESIIFFFLVSGSVIVQEAKRNDIDKNMVYKRSKEYMQKLDWKFKFSSKRRTAPHPWKLYLQAVAKILFVISDKTLF